MSRLYLIFFLGLFSTQVSAQVKLKKLVDFADEQYKNGDYYYALEYYKQALDRDSTSLELMWKYAETQRAYKNYVDAADYYERVYARDEGAVYPESILYLALMEKQMGAYKNAFSTMKLAKKNYSDDRTTYLYKKATQEVESIAWVLNNLRDSSSIDQAIIRLPENINSNNSEFGHTVHGNSFIFSSLRADSINDINEEVYSKTYKTKLYTSEIKNGVFEENKKITSLESKKLNAGNGSFSSDGKRFYFSMCSDIGYSYSCKILVANFENGEWSTIDTLNETINEPGKNTTMPFITKISGKEMLFFASDREGTKGGMDIWMSVTKNGDFTKPINCGKINSLDNELSPWFDSITNRLYFSSSWHYGFGGQDIFFSDFNKDFSAPKNLKIPINSPANDQYFFKHNDTIYFSSNRIGSFYSKNPTCCSDIYASFPIRKSTDNNIIDSLKQKEIDENTVLNTPIRLYFKNDEPDAKSWAIFTSQDYEETFNLYKKDFSTYLLKVGESMGAASALSKQIELQQFFKDEVEKGFEDLVIFKNVLLKELNDGSKIIIHLKGFASPLAKTNYNVALTKRRVSSLVNYFNECNEGVFKKYIDGQAINGGKLSFSFASFGEYVANQETSDDILDQKNSVFSKEAAIERKIEIEKIEVEKKNITFPLFCQIPLVDFGEVKKKALITGSFIVESTSNQDLEIAIINEDSNFECTIEKNQNNSYEVRFIFNPSELEGLIYKSLILSLKGFKEKLELFITAEIIP
ncbi:MAG: tetratricopeptide repeat protein [Flavobacteriia bacterium]|nr:tetratricopeptide repeat protein [Flavobacteriia bacterium]